MSRQMPPSTGPTAKSVAAGFGKLKTSKPKGARMSHTTNIQCMLVMNRSWAMLTMSSVKLLSWDWALASPLGSPLYTKRE